jgi:Arc/MetJ family transcription regulator
MAAAATPIKVDEATDALIAHASHFLGRTKKDFVDSAVREYVDNHRDEINQAVRDALRQLDGTLSRSVSLVTGLSKEELDALGGFDT